MTEYHYIISVRTVRGTPHTMDGLVTVPQGAPRQQCFAEVLERVQTRYGAIDLVVFFDVQPNRM